MLMDELMRERPLANTTGSGVDQGYEEESEDYSPDANPEQSILSDDESSFDEAAGSSTQQTTVAEDSGPRNFQQTRTSRKRPRGNSGYARAMQTWATEQQSFYQKMQESQNKWIEEQQERWQQREERLFVRFLEENTLSTERVVRQCFDGLKSIMTQMTPPPQGRSPVPPYPQHQYPGQSRSAQFPQNPSYNSDYHLHDQS
ncbi:uncharacterized protein LOC119412085 [Nematolebias whitei]|uniref:uncharacterized protein LOC119412085 n=1 Tax=Nematolebias whitei TaxID=451745 RepID=UPI001899E5AC|nr:uncharacterized protein LOC119412085 [Nematolebias whitei]